MEPVRLSPRQLEAFRLSCRGLTNAQIADRLFVTTQTIKSHLTAAYRAFREIGCGDASCGNRATLYCYWLGLADANVVFPPPDHTEEWG